MVTRREMLKGIETGMGWRLAANTPQKRLESLYADMRDIRKRISNVSILTAKRAKRLRLLIKKNCPVDTGALKLTWNDPKTVQILPTGKVEIDNPRPYARIQDLGGIIHRVSSKGKHYTIRIKAQHYVGKAIRQYNAQFREIVPVKQGAFATG